MKYFWFTGYNCPEKHKHHKQMMNNLSCSEILTHSLTLQDSIQSKVQKGGTQGIKESNYRVDVIFKSVCSLLTREKQDPKDTSCNELSAAIPNESSHTEYIPKITVAIPSALKPIDEVL